MVEYALTVALLALVVTAGVDWIATKVNTGLLHMVIVIKTTVAGVKLGHG